MSKWEKINLELGTSVEINGVLTDVVVSCPCHGYGDGGHRGTNSEFEMLEDPSVYIDLGDDCPGMLVEFQTLSISDQDKIEELLTDKFFELYYQA